MKFSKPIPVKELAEKLGARIIGNTEQSALGINEIHKVEEGDITFVDVEKYFQKSLTSAATIIILNKETDCPPGKTLLLVEDPFKAYNDTVVEHRPVVPFTKHISDTAFVHPTAIIEPGAIIGHYAIVGANSHIQANAYIGEYAVIGNNVVIQAGAIIGSDAFYFKRTPQRLYQWRSCGRTLVHDNAIIGAGCTLNRGVSGDTIIGEGTVLDSQIHIGHGAVIGKHCLIVAQVGIGGKTTIGDHVVLYGQVGVAQNVNIPNKVTVLAASGVSKNLEEGKTYFGVPAEEATDKYREIIALRQLPGLMQKLNGKNNS